MADEPQALGNYSRGFGVGSKRWSDGQHAAEAANGYDKTITFKDCSAWRNRNPLFRVAHEVARRFTRNSGGKPLVIRGGFTRPSGPIDWAWHAMTRGARAKTMANGPGNEQMNPVMGRVKKDRGVEKDRGDAEGAIVVNGKSVVRADVKSSDDEVILSNSGGNIPESAGNAAGIDVSFAKEAGIPSGAEGSPGGAGRKFLWSFTQEIQFNFSAGARHFGRRQFDQKLVGFAYAVNEVRKDDADPGKGIVRVQEAADLEGQAAGGSVEGQDGDAVKEKRRIRGFENVVDAFKNNDRPVVVFFGGHGNPVETIGAFGDCYGAAYVEKKQANFLALNYRGYGRSSDGVPSNRSMVEDGVAILNHLLKSGIASERIILHGYSMGGNIAANVLEAAEAQDFKLGGLILDRPMEKLSTGAESLAKKMLDVDKDSKERSLKQRIFPKIAWFLAKFFCESYSTDASLKALMGNRGKKEGKQWAPVVGAYDDDPIGLTSKRLLDNRGVDYRDTGYDHDGNLDKALDALETIPDFDRLFEPSSPSETVNLDAAPEGDIETARVKNVLPVPESKTTRVSYTFTV